MNSAPIHAAEAMPSEGRLDDRLGFRSDMHTAELSHLGNTRRTLFIIHKRDTQTLKQTTTLTHKVFCRCEACKDLYLLPDSGCFCLKPSVVQLEALNQHFQLISVMCSPRLDTDV
jgi:hypothetical protein